MDPETWQRLAYESPIMVALGPHWSAISCGYAVIVGDRAYITPAGKRYLERYQP